MKKRIADSRENVSDLESKQLQVRRKQDLVLIRAYGRSLAARLGFSKNDQTLIATALSELGRNVLQYAGSGNVRLSGNEPMEQKGITIVVTDQGPGIQNVEQAMTEGFSTGKGMGIGLTGAQRIMDQFEVESQIGKGTTITMRKWVRSRNKYLKGD